MSTQKFSKFFPLFAVLVLAALIAVPGCKKKMPAEEPPPEDTVMVEPVEEMPEDTTGQAMKELMMEMERDITRIQTVYFAFDRSEISPTELEKISANADIFQRWEDWAITVEGHCDERGTNEYNLALGERRARAASRALQAEGISGDRINIVSYGEERPADPGSNERAWDRNRRAEFKVDTGMSMERN